MSPASESRSIGLLITAFKFFKVFRQAPSRTLHRSRHESAWRRMQRQAREPDSYLSLLRWIHKLHTGVITRVEPRL